MQSSINNKQLKNIIKMAVTKVFEERQDLLRGVIEAAFEDLEFSQAIKEGKKNNNYKKRRNIQSS